MRWTVLVGVAATSGCASDVRFCDGVVDDHEHATVSDPDGPHVVSVRIGPDSATPDGDWSVVADLCHPDGIDQIDTMRVTAGDTPVVDRLELSSSPATFLGIVEWDTLAAATGFQFVGQFGSIPIRIEVTDEDDRTATWDDVLVAYCRGGGACGGACTSLDSDPENCGVCEGRCAALDQPHIGPECRGGKCQPAWSPCAATRPHEGAARCTNICSQQTESCVADGCLGGTVRGYADRESCEAFDEPIATEGDCEAENPADTTPFVRCCCTDSV